MYDLDTWPHYTIGRVQYACGLTDEVQYLGGQCLARATGLQRPSSTVQVQQDSKVTLREVQIRKAKPALL